MSQLYHRKVMKTIFLQEQAICDGKPVDEKMSGRLNGGEEEGSKQ